MQGVWRYDSSRRVWCVRLAVEAELPQSEREPPAILVRPHMLQEVIWIQPHNRAQEEPAHFRQQKGGGVEVDRFDTRASNLSVLAVHPLASIYQNSRIANHSHLKVAMDYSCL